MQIIKVEYLSKKYTIGHDKAASGVFRGISLRDTLTHEAKGIYQRLRHPLSPNRENTDLEEFWALKDINFDINQGDRIGIVGRNGAGKSTLLKILSRITEPTTGKINIKGRVASLLEVGTGFHAELSGRENIYLNGAILGMKRVEIRKKFDDIVAFAEVEKFLDTPVKHYSSGMYVRLAFAVAAHLEPEILIVDEVLAVGDAQFQKKCLGKMNDVAKNQGRTVLFVSHNMSAVSSLCSKGIYLDRGCIGYSGDISEVTRRYLMGDAIFAEGKMEWVNLEKETSLSDYVIIERYSVNDENGDIPTKTLYSSKKYDILIDAEILKPNPNLAFYVSYYTLDNTLLFISDIHDSGPGNALLLTKGKKRLVTRVPVELFNSQEYQIELSCVIHYMGWPLIPNPGQRLTFSLARDSNLNEMGYDQANHPFSGARKPGFFNPVIKWKVIGD